MFKMFWKVYKTFEIAPLAKKNGKTPRFNKLKYFIWKF